MSRRSKKERKGIGKLRWWTTVGRAMRNPPIDATNTRSPSEGAKELRGRSFPFYYCQSSPYIHPYAKNSQIRYSRTIAACNRPGDRETPDIFGR